MGTARTRTRSSRTTTSTRKVEQQQETPVEAAATPAAAAPAVAEAAAVEPAQPVEPTALEQPAEEAPAEQVVEQGDSAPDRLVEVPAGARGFDLAGPVTFAGIEWTPADADPFGCPIGAALAAELAAAS